MATEYTEIQEIQPGLNNARIQSHLIMIRTYFKFVAPWLLLHNQHQNVLFFRLFKNKFTSSFLYCHCLPFWCHQHFSLCPCPFLAEYHPGVAYMFVHQLCTKFHESWIKYCQSQGPSHVCGTKKQAVSKLQARFQVRSSSLPQSHRNKGKSNLDPGLSIRS